MIIDWIYGLVGGLFIGLGGLILLIFNGRIMGASGILGQLIDGKQDTENLERIVFLIGVIAAPLIILQFSDFSTTNVTSNTIQLVLAGLSVGAGTRIANGCTSGHGVCGISRLSLRGLLATAVYIAAGALTMVTLRTFWGLI
tara:strand:+ start:237 stop:662 length:426 start_codon:yes stop_codon:yes gene_type:complete